MPIKNNLDFNKGTERGGAIPNIVVEYLNVRAVPYRNHTSYAIILNTYII